MRLHAPGLAFAFVASLTMAALAVPPDVQRRADEMFLEARRAMDRSDFRGALQILGASHDLDPTRGKLVNMAVCEERLGMVASALAHVLEVDDQIPGDDPRRPIVDDYLVKLPPRVPHLRVTLAVGAPPGTRLTLDGELLANTKLGTDLPVDPGPHVLIATAPGRLEQRFDITLEEGKKTTLEVRAGAEPTPPAPVPAATGGPSLSTVPTGSGAGVDPAARRIAPGIVFAGVGALGIGAGIGLLAARSGARSEAQELGSRITGAGKYCTAGAPSFDAERCPDLWNLTSRGDALGTASIVGFVAGGLAAVGTVVYFAWPSRPSRKQPPQTLGWAPVIGPRAQGIAVWGSF
jgi:hypothetical protein